MSAVTAAGRIGAGSPALLWHGNMVVPRLARWANDQKHRQVVVLRQDQRGITFLDEGPGDRNRQGVLVNRGWRHAPAGQRGVPRFKSIDDRYQRRAMRNLLCQICPAPAHRDERGVLWLIDRAHGSDRPAWPEGHITGHPPVCLRCAVVSGLQCPALKSRGYIAVRVRNPVPHGVSGRLYEALPGGPSMTLDGLAGLRVVHDQVVLRWDDRQGLPWVLAGELTMTLNDCTVVDLREEYERVRTTAQSPAHGPSAPERDGQRIPCPQGQA